MHHKEETPLKPSFFLRLFAVAASVFMLIQFAANPAKGGESDDPPTVGPAPRRELPPPEQGPAHVTTTPYATDGTQVQADLPVALHTRNVGGSDGLGLCVFTSILHSSYFQNVVVLQEFRAWMQGQPGGGWPDKVDEMIRRFCAAKGYKLPAYIQIENNDLAILQKACKSGRCVCVTYSVSPTGRYNGQQIAHMVNIVAAGAGKGPDGRGWYCVLDNNFPGSYEWMSEAQFLRAYRGSSRGWSIVFVNPSAPPSPKN